MTFLVPGDSSQFRLSVCLPLLGMVLQLLRRTLGVLSDHLSGFVLSYDPLWKTLRFSTHSFRPTTSLITSRLETVF